MRRDFTSRLANTAGFAVAVLAALVLAAALIRPAHGTVEIKNGLWTDDVIVYYMDTKGWHWRRSKVEHIAGANVFFCIQHMPEKTGTCFYTSGDVTGALEKAFPWEDNT